jgi:hypothetical protein
MPAGPPTHRGKALFDQIDQQLAQINAWIRTFSADTGWVPLPGENSWTSSIEYRLRNKSVTIRGQLSGGVTTKAAVLLPENARPGRQEVFSFASNASGSEDYVVIETDGQIIPHYTGSPAFLSLSGINFTTD